MTQDLPVVPDAVFADASTLSASGRQVEARGVLVRLLRARPGHLPALRLLIEIEQRLGNRLQAIALIEDLIRLQPVDRRNWLWLGDACAADCDWNRSADAYGHAGSLSPPEAPLLARQALMLIMGQRIREAATVRDRLLAEFPGAASAHLIDGHIQKFAGRLQDAEAAYRRALTLDPDSCEAAFNLTDVAVLPTDDPLVARLESLRTRVEAGGFDQANVEFAMARVHEQQRDYEAAFAGYGRANDAARNAMALSGVVYDHGREEERIRSIIEEFPVGVFREPLERLPLDLRLVFVVGMPRSGTTLVERILGMHSQVASVGEVTFAPRAHARFRAARAVAGRTEAVDPGGDDAALLAELREWYLERLPDEVFHSDFVIDKLPANFEILGFLKLLFPDAVFVHCSREPAANCWSLYASNFGVHDPWYNSLADLPHYYGLYETVMAHWNAVLAGGIVECRYESLVANPEGEIRRLVEACGLDWEEQCLAFEGNPAAVSTASHAQVRRPINSDSLERWRCYAGHLQGLEAALAASARRSGDVRCPAGS